MTDPLGVDDTAVRDAVRDADLRVLLMSVFHLTGDPRWLREPFRPQRDARLVAPEDAGLDDAVADEIRAAAVACAGLDPAIVDPGDDLMVEMMEACLGQRVPPEYAPMMREELGLLSREVEWPAGAERPSVLVVGAGSSGIVIGTRLDRMGIDYDLVEQGRSVGGVWRDNRYPGAGVDTPNHAYSFSFAEPFAWSRFFAPQPELEEYLQRTANECKVSDHIEFGTELVGATWDEHDSEWSVQLRTAAGVAHRSYQVLISAIGQLNVPKDPPVPGTELFNGPCFHSSRWPDDLDVSGKRVAVIGTGASAMQIVPSIAESVGQLTVYQRSAQWARPIPRYHDAIPAGSQWLFEHLPFYAAWFRFIMLWRYGDGLLPYLRKDPDWAHPERAVNEVNDRHREEMTDHIRDELDGRPDLLAKCMPTYPPYGKRILLDNGWFSAMRRSNVELVVDPVDAVDATGVTDATGRHEDVDVIVLANGFEHFQGAGRLGIVGRDGVELAEEWADDDPSAYLGVTVAGFPNFFLMQGPTTGLGHGGSAIFQAECQARHITGCIAALAAEGGSTIEVDADRQRAYTDSLDAAHEDLIWTHPGMRNWYRNDAGRVVAVMPWRLVDYWAMTHDPDRSAFSIR